MKITLSNRLPVALAERGIRSAAEFGRKLTDVGGYPLSTAQATRYMKDSTPQFERAFIQAACNVLQCMPNDLFAISVELAPGEEIDQRVSLPWHAGIKRLPMPGKSTNEVADLPPVNSLKSASSSASEIAKKRASFKSDDSITGPSATVFPTLK